MITIDKSITAYTRSYDVTKVSKEQLYASSVQHIADVLKGIQFFQRMLYEAAEVHDADKLTDIDQFYSDFITNFDSTVWWSNHKKTNRHHLLTNEGVPDDVNLIDVLEMIVDCVMAGKARSGQVYPLHIPVDVLQEAFNNTVTLLINEVQVKEDK